MEFSCSGFKVRIVNGDICDFEGDAIVNPANTRGTMGGGVALAIKRRGGEEIEREVRARSPIPIGSAIATTAGKLRCKAVIHAPTVVLPGGPSSEEYVYLATLAAIRLAMDMGYRSVALPLMGAGVGGLSPELSARAMMRAMQEGGACNMEVYIYVRDIGLVEAVGEVIKKVCEGI